MPAPRAGRSVTLLARDAGTAAGIARSRESPRLPGSPLDQSIRIAAVGDDTGEHDAVLLAVPAQAAARRRDRCRTKAARRHADDRLR